ncbi:MAG: Mfa1 family fimbria major subunit [Prevotella sp.]|nr:Mfa1 family fimbria major subunit [Bacteroidaceae bacterium]MBR1416089.1 Mfa1 family fimbria major subunit [Prevotella sp.]
MAPCLLTVLLLTACINDSETDGDAASIVNVGDPVPAFTLSGSDGSETASAALHGRVFILNFFDTGCPDCQKELQVLQQIYERYGDGVPLLNVPRSQTKSQVQAYWETAALTMPFHMPSDQALYYQFATSTIPRTYVVDTQGKVFAAFSDDPVADYATLDTLLQQLGATPAEGNEQDVQLSVRVKVAAPAPSNLPPKGEATDDYYFHNEYTISRLELYFFYADSKEFFTKVAVSDLTPEDALADTEYDITYIFEDVRLKADKYDIFAIANYDYGPDEVDDEASFLDMVDSLTYRQGVEANISDKGPVMTSNATSLLGIDLVPWVNKDYVLKVDMERVMAKLQIGVSQNTFSLEHNQRKYADINITNYKMVNLNTRYYLFRHTDNLPTFTERTTFDLPYSYGDYSDEGDQYVVDPLFYQKTASSSAAALFLDYYKSWFGNFTTSDFASMPSADNYGYAYILENTAFKTSQKNGYSPGIVFKAAVSPVFVYLYDSRQHTLEEEYRPEYWPNSIYLYNYNFYESIRAVNIASGLTLDELETYTDAQLRAYGIKQCKFNMGVYETYYTYWIRHRADSEHPMGPMEYGIVRNNFYRMVITGINGIGNSVITPDIMRDNYPNSYTDVEVN